MKHTPIAVVLPAYNEELTIEAVIREFHAALPEAAIWVVNNRSSDQTAALAAATLQQLGCSGGVIHEARPGKGNAVRRAFMDIQADVYVLADADLTYPANQARRLIEPVLDGVADMVVGDRHSQGHYAAENKRQFHGFGNRLVKNMVNAMFRARLQDIMSGYRVFNRHFVKNYPILVDGFEIETDMTLHALDKRFRIVEIPVDYKDRPEGSFSKLNTFRDGMRVLLTIGNILRHYKPLVFFGGVAVIFAGLGLAAGAPVLMEWALTRYINRIPLAILATGLMILAALSGAIGLLLDSIAHQDRRNFERDLLNPGSGHRSS